MINSQLWQRRSSAFLLFLGLSFLTAMPALWAETIYYPGYLAYYPYGDGSFVYSLPKQEVVQEAQVVPMQPARIIESPAGVPVPAVAAARPGQAEVSRVMLGGYSVHVGSFLKAEEAEQMESALQKLGLPFFLSPAVSNGVTYTQLHAGPYQVQDQAFTASDTIRDHLGLQGIVLAHGPKQNSSGK
ncbi:SPOR domain-containing protein [Candidatus Magnetaquicoccus inordinatus]|uniref:SPOR domain-containing protein n=1 Tax=Candidatus Magnetaquicoccus inordinatus TaxID=2496818 RepID=UPI00102BC7BC|nr:SPOR domain-containing protein [Candidatus Magnetaquicoccus inordinatus]